VFFTNYRSIVRLLKRRCGMYRIAGMLIVSFFMLCGCNGSKSVPQDATLASVKPTGQVDSSAGQETSTVSSPCGGSVLFDKMDATMYQGDPEKYGDVIFSERSLKNNVDPVVFSHRTHRTRYTCRVCHLELDFSMKKGESGVTREDYLDGRFCGACHNGKIAFPVDIDRDCDRCHVPIDSKGQYTNKDFAVKGASQQKYGDGVNWVESLQTGVISPKTSLYNKENSSSMPLPEHLKKERLRWTAKSPKYPVSVAVSFPHEAHVKWLDCANCHPDIFMVQKNGTVDFDKDKILEGQYCGVCHLTVAFPMDGCRRCHPRRKKKK